MRSGQRRVVAALFAATGLAVACGWWWWSSSRPSAEQLAREVRSALDHGRTDEAIRLAERGLQRFPRSPSVRLAAADVDLNLGRPAAALAHLREIEDDGGRLALESIGAAGDILFRLNRLSEAEVCFRRVIEVNPQNPSGRQRLALLLALSGRRKAAQQTLFAVVKGDAFDTRDLSLFGEPDKVFDNPDFVKRFEDSSPADPAAIRGRARYLLYKNKPTEALGMYRALAARSRADVDALAGYGRALLDTGASDAFLKWHAELPAEADATAEIWELRGRFAQLRSENEVAVRCFGESVRRDPNQISASSQLAVLLHQYGNQDAALAFQRRARQLRELKETLDVTLAESRRVESLLKAAALTEGLGRHWEARGWLLAAAELTGRLDLRDRARVLSESLDDEAPQTLPEANPVAMIDLTAFPRPDWNAATRFRAAGESSADPRLSRVTFSDKAAQAGLDFTYFNGHRRGANGMRIFESNGGGVAAFDYDGDLWPDLYFTQACEWPPEPGQARHLDRLYRNLGNGRFEDVTGASGLGDERYSHGVTAGDLNDDGFPDLYVGNIGQNRLYANNGDGTYTEQTAAAGLAGGGWTTSVLIADLNGDAFPEVYDVTYLAGREPFEHLCHDKQNKDVVRVCAPTVFPAEADRLFLNRGDGTLENVSQEAGIMVPDGKGLGIVAFDAAGSGQLSLYVANDMTPNFLFLNKVVRAGERPAFQEAARLLGCAVNAEGLAPASMGIAADDYDRDGLLDLFVTTFYGEYYVLFRQQP
ncbi:MAG: VCBS repeat-containing protein, partial [Planctomycetia bacterium]|nr:VCBS repeat-containing protein [Planctomycetia bacterium]